MRPAENAMRLALLVLKEIAGETRITNGDDETFRSLMREARQAADRAGVEVTDVYTSVVHGLEDTNPRLFNRLKNWSELLSRAERVH